jgi:hypothetical protein
LRTVRATGPLAQQQSSIPAACSRRACPSPGAAARAGGTTRPAPRHALRREPDTWLSLTSRPAMSGQQRRKRQQQPPQPRRAARRGCGAVNYSEQSQQAGGCGRANLPGQQPSEGAKAYARRLREEAAAAAAAAAAAPGSLDDAAATPAEDDAWMDTETERVQTGEPLEPDSAAAQLGLASGSVQQQQQEPLLQQEPPLQQPPLLQHQQQREMDAAEKEQLINAMHKLPSEYFDRALFIIKSSHPALYELDADEDLEIDFDCLDSPTLWKLHAFCEDPRTAAPA